MSVTVRLDTSKLNNLIADINSGSPELVETVARTIQRDARMLAPHVTGYLINSIEAERERPLSWLINVYADYGVYVELGTYKMTPRPYLFPAVERAYRVFVEAWKRMFR
jgi:hypothetical protein